MNEIYMNGPICHCVFIKNSKYGFAIVTIYVDDINLIRNLEDIQNIADYLKGTLK